MIITVAIKVVVKASNINKSRDQNKYTLIVTVKSITEAKKPDDAHIYHVNFTVFLVDVILKIGWLLHFFVFLV